MFSKGVFLFFGLITVGSNQVLASGYQYELGARYSARDDNLFNQTRTQAAFRIYLQPVNFDNKPYNEVAFLARKTNLSVSMGQLEYEIDLGIASLDIDSTLIGVNLEYAKTGNPVIFRVGFETAEGDEEFFGQDVNTDMSSVSASLGYYTGPFSKIGFQASQTEVEIGTNTGTFELETNTYYIEYVTLQQLASLKYYSVEARFGRVEVEDVDLDQIQVGGNYYYSLFTSFGALLGIVASDEDSAEGKSVLLRIRHFVDPYTAIAFSFDKFFSDKDSDNDSDTTRLDFIHRF